MIKVVSVNVFNLYGNRAERDRFRRVEEMIRRIDADIVAVQEIVARPPSDASGPDKCTLAARHVRALAEAVGRECEVDGQVVFALGGGIHHTALLWRDGIEPGAEDPRITPVAGKVGRYERDPAGMWHSLVTVVFDVGGPKLRVGSVQMSPFDPGRGWGWSDAGQVMRAMNSDATPGVVGGDWNGLGATTVRLPDGSIVYYDPDPYAGVAWHPDHAYQFGPDGRVDRGVAQRLEGPGRFRDCARIAGAAWAATTGRYPADKHPSRRIDRWYATYHFPDAAVTGHEVVGAEVVGESTDHDPVLLHVDEARLAG